MSRKDKALQILQSYRKGDYRYLGEGSEGVVYTDNQKIYKIYDSNSDNKLIFLKASMPVFRYAIHLYEIEDIINFQNHTVLIYPYEDSEPIIELCKEDFIGFLVEMWQRKLITKNIKPENFVRVKGTVKLIDYELEPYTDNLFLNMCVRSFIFFGYKNLPAGLRNDICQCKTHCKTVKYA